MGWAKYEEDNREMMQDRWSSRCTDDQYWGYTAGYCKNTYCNHETSSRNTPRTKINNSNATSLKH